MGKGRRRSREVPDVDPGVEPAEVQPVDVDGVRTVAMLTVMWAIAFVVLAFRTGSLEVNGRGWWLWTCLAGVGLGLLGLEYTRKRRDAIELARAEAEEGELHDGDDDGQQNRHGMLARSDEVVLAERPSPDDSEPSPPPEVRADGPVQASSTELPPLREQTSPNAGTRPIEGGSGPQPPDRTRLDARRPASGDTSGHGGRDHGSSLPGPVHPGPVQPPVHPGAVQPSVQRGPLRPGTQPPAGLRAQPNPAEPGGMLQPGVRFVQPAAVRPSPSEPVTRPGSPQPGPRQTEPTSPVDPVSWFEPVQRAEPDLRTAPAAGRGQPSAGLSDSPDLDHTAATDAAPSWPIHSRGRAPRRGAGLPASELFGNVTPPADVVSASPPPATSGPKPPASRTQAPDEDEPLLDTTLGGGRRARRYDTTDEIEEITEGGGRQYRGRRARRSDSA